MYSLKLPHKFEWGLILNSQLRFRLLKKKVKSNSNKLLGKNPV